MEVITISCRTWSSRTADPCMPSLTTGIDRTASWSSISQYHFWGCILWWSSLAPSIDGFICTSFTLTCRPPTLSMLQDSCKPLRFCDRSCCWSLPFLEEGLWPFCLLHTQSVRSNRDFALRSGSTWWRHREDAPLRHTEGCICVEKPWKGDYILNDWSACGVSTWIKALY